MKNICPKAIQKTEISVFQGVRSRAKHVFQWSRGGASCTCDQWTLSGASLASAKRSHGYHRCNTARALEAQLLDEKFP